MTKYMLSINIITCYTINVIYMDLKVLQNELKELKEKLKNISVTRQLYTKNGQYIHFIEYKDPINAVRILKRINLIKTWINIYDTHIKKTNDDINQKNELTIDRPTKEEIKSYAYKLYQEELDNYHQKSLIGKISYIMTYGKPHKELTADEILKEYGGMSEYRLQMDLIKQKIDEVKARMEEELKWNKEHNTDPHTIAFITAAYDKKIAYLENELLVYFNGDKELENNESRSMSIN